MAHDLQDNLDSALEKMRDLFPDYEVRLSVFAEYGAHLDRVFAVTELAAAELRFAEMRRSGLGRTILALEMYEGVPSQVVSPIITLLTSESAPRERILA